MELNKFEGFEKRRWNRVIIGDLIYKLDDM